MNNQTVVALLGWLERIEVKLDGLTKDMAAVKADIAYHIKRTDLLEEDVRSRASKQQVEELEKEIKPVVTHVSRLKWLAGALVAIAGAYRIAQTNGWLP